MSQTTVLKNAEDIHHAIDRLVHAILASENGLDDMALIGVHSRGFPLAKRLLERLQAARPGKEIPLGSLDITLYRDDLAHAVQKAEVKGSRIPFDVKGRRIILVDDVIFTGRTTRAAIDQVMDFGRPRVIELVVLVDRGHRELPFAPNATGFTVSTSREQRVRVRLSEVDGVDEIVLEEPTGDA